MTKDYDTKAEECNWRGPEVAFGLSYAFINSGESILDVGIGTGLSSILFHKAGLRVHGMDVSAEMLEVCRRKGFAADLKRHDLTVEPYPYDSESMDHAVCLGVLNHFRDLHPVFRQVARILRQDGVFVFMVADRAPGEDAELVVGEEHTHADSAATIYRHSTEGINGLLSDHDFTIVRCVEFLVPMDRERSSALAAKVYLVKRNRRTS